MLKYCEELAIKLPEVRAIQSNDNSQEAGFYSHSCWFHINVMHLTSLALLSIHSTLGRTRFCDIACWCPINCDLRTTITIKMALSFKIPFFIWSILRERKVPHMQYFMLSFNSCYYFHHYKLSNSLKSSIKLAKTHLTNQVEHQAE